MTFWALGNLKELSEKFNIKDVGAKIKSYVAASSDFNKEDEEIQNDLQNRSEAKEKREMSVEDLMARQMIEYKKLSELQRKIIKQYEDREKKCCSSKIKELEKQLNEIEESEKVEEIKGKKEKLKGEIVRGEKSLEEVIEQNIEMKEALLRRQVRKQ